MSEQEPYYDESTEEFVIELDGSNEYLNSLLREANEEADKWSKENPPYWLVEYEKEEAKKNEKTN